MRIWVAPINDAPTFTDGPPQVVVGEDSGAYSAPWATDVSPGPPSESWQTVHFEADTPPNGVPNLFAVPPAIDESGNLTFTPNPDEVGLVHVTVRAMDDGGLEDWQSPDQAPPDDTSDDVTFDIVVMQDDVTAVDDEATLPEDPTDPWLIDVLDNDDFPAEATMTAVTQGTLGLVTIAPDGLSVFYTPDPDANGNDSFTYTLDDGAGSADTATVDVTSPRATTILSPATMLPPSGSTEQPSRSTSWPTTPTSTATLLHDHRGDREREGHRHDHRRRDRPHLPAGHGRERGRQLQLHDQRRPWRVRRQGRSR